MRDDSGSLTALEIEHYPGMTEGAIATMGEQAVARWTLTDANALDKAAEEVGAITGQKPIINRAKRSIANFRLREGNPIGVSATLRGDRMFEFLDRLIIAALPRIRDFQGLNANAFDGRGNYSLGIREQLIFPEIDYDKVDKVRGLQVTIVTTAKSDEEGRRLLELMGMPFQKN